MSIDERHDYVTIKILSSYFVPIEWPVKDNEAPGKRLPLAWTFHEVLALLAVLIVFVSLVLKG